MGETGRLLAAGFGGLSRGAYNLSQGWGRRHDFNKSLNGEFGDTTDPELYMKLKEIESKNKFYTNYLPSKLDLDTDKFKNSAQLALQSAYDDRIKVLRDSLKTKGLTEDEKNAIKYEMESERTNYLNQSRKLSEQQAAMGSGSPPQYDPNSWSTPLTNKGRDSGYTPKTLSTGINTAPDKTTPQQDEKFPLLEPSKIPSFLLKKASDYIDIPDEYLKPPLNIPKGNNSTQQKQNKKTAPRQIVNTEPQNIEYIRDSNGNFIQAPAKKKPKTLNELKNYTYPGRL